MWKPDHHAHMGAIPLTVDTQLEAPGVYAVELQFLTAPGLLAFVAK